MLKRITNYLNKKKIATEGELTKAPAINLLFGDSDIPLDTVREYCHRLVKSGYIYNYGGVYKLAQFIPKLYFKDLTELNFEDRLLYQYNRLHSLGYPYCDECVYREMSMLDHFHLLQYIRFDETIYDFKLRFKKESSYVNTFINHMIKHDYIEVKDGWVHFTGKYIPFSVTAKNFKSYNRDRLDISYTLTKEEELIDELGAHIGKKEFKSKSFDDINFITKLHKELGLEGNPRALKVLFDSWNRI